MFLATTALDDFWDKTQKDGIFLGDWCRLYAKQGDYADMEWKTLEYIWKDEKEIDYGIRYCDDVYNHAIDVLSSILNKIHGLNKDLRYWDIVLRPWLFQYIQIIYDKYRHLKLAKEKYPNIYTYTLHESSYSFVNTSLMSLTKIIDSDLYNLQLYSQIAKFLEINSKDIEYDYVKDDLDITIKTKSLKEKFLLSITKIANKIFNKKSVLMVSPYFKHRPLLKYLTLSLKSKFLFVFDNFNYALSVSNKINLSQRKIFFENILFQNEFERILFKTLVYSFPSIYLENYIDFRDHVLKLPIEKSKVIYSANAIHTNEIFKFYIAENHKNLLIVYAQHGGGIGLDKINISEEIETQICDIYFTYGWQRKNTRVLPQCAIKKNSYFLKKYSNIVLVMTVLPRYFYRFMYLADSSKMLRYIYNNQIFVKEFDLFSYLTIRPYMQDYGWDIKKRLLEVNSNLTFDNKTNYYKQIKKARLVVFDHMHTGYLETLSANIPTVIFISEDIYCFRESAMPYIKILNDANILFYDPIKAASFINANYDDIEKWWYSSKTQQAREKFCYQYIRTSNNWVNEWIIEFNKILEKNARN
ncbi:LIC12162 family transferase [Campylobacter hyointestinalis]|uniref:LIC12162 family transferase n=1 Tax=Campylobacter hyointestinalis TaxID=198 RepID=UPI000CE4C31C|nr:LIC12162 family protein [Campylobacter hyointestinalis]PPB66808.1 hypothetical protein CDQ76_08080 [Campylobacter hyointestinalis subsp. hyointestinalis]